MQLILRSKDHTWWNFVDWKEVLLKGIIEMVHIRYDHRKLAFKQKLQRKKSSGMLFEENLSDELRQLDTLGAFSASKIRSSSLKEESIIRKFRNRKKNGKKGLDWFPVCRDTLDLFKSWKPLTILPKSSIIDFSEAVIQRTGACKFIKKETLAQVF